MEQDSSSRTLPNHVNHILPSALFSFSVPNDMFPEHTNVFSRRPRAKKNTEKKQRNICRLRNTQKAYPTKAPSRTRNPLQLSGVMLYKKKVRIKRRISYGGAYGSHPTTSLAVISFPPRWTCTFTSPPTVESKQVSHGRNVVINFPFMRTTTSPTSKTPSAGPLGMI